MSQTNDNPEDPKLILARRNIRDILMALGQFRDLNVAMPVGSVMAFLSVALNEGASLTDIAEDLDMKKSTTSRYLLDLSSKTRSGGDGYGLVTREQDPAELRRNMYSLTPKGRNLLKRMVGSAKPSNGGA